MTIDLEELAALVRLLKDAEFSEFNYSRGDTVVHVRRGDLIAAPAIADPQPQPVPAAPQSVPAAVVPAAVPTGNSGAAVSSVTPPAAVEGAKVPAPLLGTFYSAPKPGEPAFVKVGDRVTPDTVVCIVEVMKLMNSVSAGVSGILAAIHARDGDLVEHGQPLFTVVEAS